MSRCRCYLCNADTSTAPTPAGMFLCEQCRRRDDIAQSLPAKFSLRDFLGWSEERKALLLDHLGWSEENKALYLKALEFTGPLWLELWVEWIKAPMPMSFEDALRKHFGIPYSIDDAAGRR